jgi:hypothetical protein
MDLKAFVSLGKLSVADIPLKDELFKELAGFSFVESDGGGFTIKSGAKNDDLAMSLAASVIPLLQRRILERAAPGAIPSILNYPEMVK